MSDRFTPTALDLARKLALPREFREGDWWCWDAHDERDRHPRLWLERDHLPRRSNDDNQAVRRMVWLPTVEDCFELLRGGGWRYSLSQEVVGATPLEAMYRLLAECGIGGKGE